MRFLQEIYIGLMIFFKHSDCYYYVKFQYIKPDSKLGLWKYKVLDKNDDIIMEN